RMSFEWPPGKTGSRGKVTRRRRKPCRHALAVETNSELQQEARPNLPSVLKPKANRQSARPGLWVAECLYEHIRPAALKCIERGEYVDTGIAISESSIQSNW